MKGRKVVWESLQPGCIVVRYDPDKVQPHELLPDAESWKEMEKRGFYGGVMLPKWAKMTSLNDVELAQMGLQKIPRSKKK